MGGEVTCYELSVEDERPKLTAIGSGTEEYYDRPLHISGGWAEAKTPEIFLKNRAILQGEKVVLPYRPIGTLPVRFNLRDNAVPHWTVECVKPNGRKTDDGVEWEVDLDFPTDDSNQFVVFRFTRGGGHHKEVGFEVAPGKAQYLIKRATIVVDRSGEGKLFGELGVSGDTASSALRFRLTFSGTASKPVEWVARCTAVDGQTGCSFERPLKVEGNPAQGLLQVFSEDSVVAKSEASVVWPNAVVIKKLAVDFGTTRTVVAFKAADVEVRVWDSIRQDFVKTASSFPVPGNMVYVQFVGERDLQNRRSNDAEIGDHYKYGLAPTLFSCASVGKVLFTPSEDGPRYAIRELKKSLFEQGTRSYVCRDNTTWTARASEILRSRRRADPQNACYGSFRHRCDARAPSVGGWLWHSSAFGRAPMA
jgi:hypothetical protein